MSPALAALRRPAIGIIVSGLVAVALLALASCRKDGEDARSDADLVYAATIEALVTEHLDAVPPAPTATATANGKPNAKDVEEPKVLLQVFVEPLGDGYVIDLAVQARVVTALDTVARVRFIDHRAEAINEDLPGKPVRENGMLVGLGPIVDGGADQRTVQARRYLQPDRFVDTLVRISGAGESLRVVLAPA